VEYQGLALESSATFATDVSGSESPTPRPDSLVLRGEQLQRLRISLAPALRAACAYDGSVRSEQSLFARLSRLERFLARAGDTSALSRDEAERALLRQAYSASGAKRRRPLTISELLDFAVENVRRKLLSRHIRVRTVEIPLCLVPPQWGGPAMGQGNGGFEPARLDESRESEIIVLLIRKGICIDEIKIYAGVHPTHTFRKVPYRLIQIPRLMREVLVCGQVGERTFVGRDLKGPLFWASYSKDQLLRHPDVSSVIAQGQWIDLAEQLLFTNNTPKERKRCRAPSGRLATALPLSEEVIVVTALRWAAEHGWRLPAAHQGEIPWLPGQSWAGWDSVIRARGRGLNRANCRGLSHLLAIYGLKCTRGGLTEVVQGAWKRVVAGESHGLTDSESGCGLLLTVDLILTKALEWASTHGWSLPLRGSGEIPGITYDTWAAWNHALRKSSRGLVRLQCKGLGHLFEMYGLRSIVRDRHAVIEAAWQRIERGEAHGLLIQAQTTLTEDLIITKAVEFAAANRWQLPTGGMGPVQGLSGEAWAGWCWALRLRRRGLTRKGCRGLAHLLVIYCLKDGRAPNEELLREAWLRLQQGEPHGLRELDDVLANLTVDEVLAKAREWSAANGGKIPRAQSGQIPGLPITWKGADAAVRRGAGRLAQPYKNLAHLFRAHKFKSGKCGAAARSDPTAEFTDDLILTKAIGWAATHEWKLPNAKSGVVPGLPGQTWRDGERAVSARLSFGRSGLRTLFQDYGLTRDGIDHVSELQAAWARLQDGHAHGLCAGHYALTEDLILRKAIEWAAAHEWQLPLPNSGAVPGRFGDTWLMYSCSLSDGNRGLTRPNCKGLPHLFRLFGLRCDRNDSVEALRKAWKRLKDGESHGLTEVPPDTGALSEVLILTKAVGWAADHDWKLPKPCDGAVPGLSGETWLRFNNALRASRRGLTRKGCAGLLSLFRLYGLVRGYRINVSLLKATWENLQQHRPLGLSDDHGDQHRLTEVFILRKAVEWAATHAWQLPTAISGAVPGLEGDTWYAFDKAIKACYRGLTRRGCSGLAHLFRMCGFKRARTTDRDRVQRAFAAARAGGLESFLQIHA
jgi:hypothetical protein